MEKNFKPLRQKEIVSLEEDSLRILIPHPTFKVIELLKSLINKVMNSDNVFIEAANKAKRDRQEIYSWCSEGIPCEVLTQDGKGWKKGKVRLALEFCPDESEIEETLTNNKSEIPQPESPLDDLRQMINQDSQQTNQ